MLFLINGIFRGSGDAAIAMRTLWMANLINMALDPCFIYGLGPFPKLGVTGAAVATTTGRSLGVLYQLYVLTRGGARVTIARRHLRLDWPVLTRLFRVARTAMMQYFIATASWLSLARINAGFGSDAVAGYSLAIRIILFALMPSWGICSAAATLVGQNLGAKRPDRSERAVWLAGLYNMSFLTIVGIVFVAAAHPLVALFRPSPEWSPLAVSCLQFVSLGYPFYAWGMIMEQAFNGAGDTATPTRINFGLLLDASDAACLVSSRGTSARKASTSRSAARSRCSPSSASSSSAAARGRRSKCDPGKRQLNGCLIPRALILCNWKVA